MKLKARPSVIFFFLFLLSVSILGCAFLSARHLHPVTTAAVSGDTKFHIYPRQRVELRPPNCTVFSPNKTCPASGPRNVNQEEDPDRPLDPTCPEYFRWIHEDLRPWAQTGITREVLKTAQSKADFRLVIVEGRAYVETYQRAFQTRDNFTLWGILQLLRRYPGKIPDLDLMFNCGDKPDVFARNYSGPGPNITVPPPVFRYCADDDTLDIVFPDWSFWGWPEINIKPWELLLKDLNQGNQRTKWIDRDPHAYWKGNSWVSLPRYGLVKCNLSHQHDWNARIYVQDWNKESKQEFKQSNLANQCVHRYKIYIEGIAWSVSDKHILACDSVTLMIKPQYYDFFLRSLVPMHHYWPIKDDDQCRSIKFAVDWGNTHKEKAQAMGKAASKFIQEELKMDFVYDYMFHSLNEYSKLLTFKPTVPPNAVELCLEAVACPAEGLARQFMMDSLVKRPAYSSPCSLQPPFNPISLDFILSRKENSIRQVQKWEENFWGVMK